MLARVSNNTCYKAVTLIWYRTPTYTCKYSKNKCTSQHTLSGQTYHTVQDAASDRRALLDLST